jgi:hypothetical protein
MEGLKKTSKYFSQEYRFPDTDSGHPRAKYDPFS